MEICINRMNFIEILFKYQHLKNLKLHISKSLLLPINVISYIYFSMSQTQKLAVKDILEDTMIYYVLICIALI